MATISDVIQGLQILETAPSYGEEKSVETLPGLIVVSGIMLGSVSEKDRIKLVNLGWHWSSANDCWARHT